MAAKATVALLLMVSGCAAKQIPETRAISASGSEQEISQLMERALQADARSESADSLYAPQAMVVVNARPRRAQPRYAGIEAGGELAITSTQLEMRGTAAWGDVEYRWISGQSNRVQVGRASFVLIPAQGRRGWWIVQAHSSTAK